MTKMNKITYLLVLICSFAHGQDLEELYVEKFKSSWEIYETDSFVRSIDPAMDSLYIKANGKGYQETLIENQKNAVKNRAEELSRLLANFNINLTDLNFLAVIEEKSLNNSPPIDFIKKGAILTPDTIIGFSHDSARENKMFQEFDYFSQSQNPTVAQAKQIIGNLILKGQTNYLDTIAKVETEMFEGPLKELSPETEFEIILYDKNSDEKLRVIYLHETFVQIMNQK